MRSKFGFYKSFNLITLSAFFSTLGIGVWIYNGFIEFGVVFISFAISLVGMMFFLLDSDYRSILRSDVRYRKKIKKFYLFSALITLVLSSIQPQLAILSIIGISIWGLYMTKEMISSYERLTGEKVE
ncbi:hypothetical protein LCL63_001150 [Vibrio fluvialis]|nr:hypothetical protein [Vibrio fluvialis]